MGLFSKKKTQTKSTRKGSGGFTLLLIPNASGETRRFSVPKFAMLFVTLLFFGGIGSFAGITYDYVQLRARVSEFEDLKAENNSIRSEAAALANKLDKVQNTLNRVDTFSDQVRQVVQLEPAVPNGKKKSTQTSGQTEKLTAHITSKAVGPLTKEEFALRKSEDTSDQAAGVVNPANLEFKELFEQLSEIEQQGGKQAKTLEFLLGDLHEYRAQLDATPTISPVKGWITSLFGFRTSPIFGQNRMHWGLDIAAPLGSPIRSAGNGTIVRVGNAEDYGKFVEVSHGYGLVTRYAHAMKIDVKVGDKVKKGDTLGAVGMTGRTTGPHLHYEIERNGRRVDPSTYIQSL